MISKQFIDNRVNKFNLFYAIKDRFLDKIDELYLNNDKNNKHLEKYIFYFIEVCSILHFNFSYVKSPKHRLFL